MAFDFIEKHSPLFLFAGFFRFQQIMYAKMQFFFPAASFLNKAFFQTIESAKRAFAARAGSGKPAFLHASFLKKKKNSRENMGQCFPVKSKVTCKNSAHLDTHTKKNSLNVT